MTRRRKAAAIAAFALCIAALGAWWVVQSRAAQTADDAAWSRWESKAPTAYSFDYSSCSGMCVGCQLHVTVNHGKATDAIARDGLCPTSARRAPTIEDIFAMEQRDRSLETTDSFEIRYDPTWGFPVSVSTRCPVGWADCGSIYTITNFRVQP